MIESQIAYVISALREMRAPGRRRRGAPEVEAALNARSSGGCRARSGTRAARAGTRTRRATTRRCGRTGRGASGAARRSSTEGVRGRMRVLITGAAGGIGRDRRAAARAGRTGRRPRPDGADTSATCAPRRPSTRGRRRDRATGRARHADQQRRPRHAAERGVAPDEGRAGGAGREPRRPVARDRRRAPRAARRRTGAWSTSRPASPT